MKIYSFPHVVIHELMNQFEPISLVALSFCSKKAHAFVKTFSKIEGGLKIRSGMSKNEYMLRFPRGATICVVSEDSRFNITSDLKTPKSGKYSFGKFGYLYVCYEDVVQGCQDTTSYICDLLKVPVVTVVVHKEEDVGILDFIQNRQKQKLKKVLALEMNDIGAEGYSRIMSSNATEYLQCNLHPPLDYRFDGKLPPVKNLVIRHGDWITRDHLLGLQSQNIQFLSFTVKGSDTNAVLRRWLTGGLAKLKYSKLYISNFEFDQDIRDRLERVQGEITYEWEPNEVVRFDTNAFHIRREDGVVATVMQVSDIWRSSFTMTVWPDIKGNCV